MTPEQFTELAEVLNVGITSFAPAFIQGMLSTGWILLFAYLACVIFLVGIVSTVITSMLDLAEDPLYQ